MFATACAIARNYTFPIVISHRTANGNCGSGIGTVVIINDEGWFVTAFHIIAQISKLKESNNEYAELLAKREIIEKDDTLIPPVKKSRLRNLKIESTSISNFSVWTASDNLKIAEVYALPDIDLAIGRLNNFDGTKITVYPFFKDPTKPMDQGTSLCKLGFPFYSITPTFEEGKGFILPPGSLPIPIFPIEGIYTRMVEIETDKPTKFPLKYVETSSPGLRGQSGGPTFDIHGAIWAIQSQTQHLKLGFGTNQTGSKEAEHLQNQYLNVGWGIHAETLISFFKEKNVKFQISGH